MKGTDSGADDKNYRGVPIFLLQQRGGGTATYPRDEGKKFGKVLASACTSCKCKWFQGSGIA